MGSQTSTDDPLGHGDRGFDERWVAVSPETSLRVWDWTPVTAQYPPVFFVPGWISTVHGWGDLLRRLTLDRRVLYVDTREKPSARLEISRLTVGDFSVSRLATDLRLVSEQIDIDVRETVAFGSSLGGTAILEAMKNDAWAVRAAFCVAPNARFRIPWWARPALRLPAALYRALKPYIIWYLRKFRVDERREPEQMERYRRTVADAEPHRLKLSARALAGYAIWPRLETVTRPVAVAFAESDTLHEVTEIERILEMVPEARPIPCPTNLYMHRPEVAKDLDRFSSNVL